jgi:hypothetical protein
VPGASPFWRRVAGMREQVEHARDLHARGGEWTRAIGSARSLSPGAFGAETGEREPGSRLTHRIFRFTAGERPPKFQTRSPRRARRGEPRRCS